MPQAQVSSAAKQLLQPSSTVTSLASPTFKPFTKMNLEELKTLQVKLTYLGIQNKPFKTIVFTSQWNKLDMKKFVPYRRQGFGYMNDDFAMQSFIATPEELQSLILSVSSFAPVAGGQIAKNPFLSIMFFNSTAQGDQIHEAVLSYEQTQEFFIYFRGALEKNHNAARLFQSWGCALGLLPPIPARDVSSQIQASQGALRFNKQKGHFETTVTLTNVSEQPVPGPISLVVDSRGSARLTDDDGVTCAIPLAGRQFLNVFFPSGPYGNFGVGEKVEVVLEFEGNDGEPIRYTTKVIGHPGER